MIYGNRYPGVNEMLRVTLIGIEYPELFDLARALLHWPPLHVVPNHPSLGIGMWVPFLFHHLRSLLEPFYILIVTRPEGVCRFPRQH